MTVTLLESNVQRTKVQRKMLMCVYVKCKCDILYIVFHTAHQIIAVTSKLAQK